MFKRSQLMVAISAFKPEARASRFLQMTKGVKSLRAAMLWALFVVLGFQPLLTTPTVAQTIPPTSPCAYGSPRVPSGWTIAGGTPDCSNRATNALGGVAWSYAPLPSTPGGHNTFATFHNGGTSSPEGIRTTMTGLVPGRIYHIPMYGMGVTHRGNAGCQGVTASTTGTAEDILFPRDTEWGQQSFTFTATSASQTLTIRPYPANSNPACFQAFYLGGEVIEVIKTVSSGGSASGDVVTFTMDVKNHGIGPLTGVSISDDILERIDGTPLMLTGGPTFVSSSGGSPQGTLQEDEIATYTATYTLTQADVDASGIRNIATAQGTDQNSNLFADASSDTPSVDERPTVHEILPEPAVELTKTWGLDDTDLDGVPDVGESIVYELIATNTGNVVLTNLVVTDPDASVTGGPIASLAPGMSTSPVSASYVLTQADIDSGNVSNQATVTADGPGGASISDLSDDPDNVTDADPEGDGEPDDPTVVTLVAAGLLDVLKTSIFNDEDGDLLADVGETISYAFTVENTGNVTLTNVTLSDDHATVSGSPIATLAPGSANAVTLTGTYTVTQADVDLGHVDNLASATGKDTSNADVTTQSHPIGGTAGTPTRTDLPQDASSDFIKTVTHDDADGDGFLDAGERLNYAFSVENTGNVTLSNVTVTDPRATLTGGPIATLAPGATDATTITGYYDVTQADIDSGSVDNVASMSAEDPNGDPIHQDSRPPGGSPGDSTSFTADAEGAIDVIKEAVLSDTDGDGSADQGEFIEFRFTVTNTGNVTLTDITIEDDKAEISGSPIAGPLAPGESDMSATGIYKVKQADIDAGVFENLAIVTGKEPQGDTVSAESRPANGLPGEATAFTFERNPAIELDLHDEWVDLNGNGFPDPNEPVNYVFTVRNTGNVTVENITMASFDVTIDTSLASSAALEPRAAVPVSGGPLASLAPGSQEGTTFTASYLLTQADIDAGGIVAKAEVEGLALGVTPVSDQSDDPLDTTDMDVEDDGEPDDPTGTPLLQNVVLAVEKTGAFEADDHALAEPGDTILYTFTVTNDGNVSLEDVVPVDAGPRFNGRPGGGSLSPFTPSSVDLAAGESASFTARYALTQGDIDAAQGIEDGVKNTALAKGTGPRGQTAAAPEVEALAELPGYAVTKTASLSEVRRGDRVPYTIRAKMLGLHGSTTVNIVDMVPPGLSFVPGSARLGGAAVTPVSAGQSLTFENVTLTGDNAVEITLDLAVTAAAEPGEYVNRAWVNDLKGKQISRVATAVVEVMADPLFDCGDIIGKVFDDENRNGYQDDGERGLAGVRVATVKGLLVTADAEGRFHIACADLPDQRIGTNYILKLDTRSLPSGYRLTTENPRVVRLTAGKVSKFLFGASVGRVVRLDLSDAAFEEGMMALRPEWQSGVAQMIELLNKEPSVLRLVYTENGEGRRLAQKRLKAMRKDIAGEWRRVGARYRLEVEAKVLSGVR